MKLDVIVPCFNEAGSIPTLYKEITNALDEIKYTIIFVNDGSNDNTEDILNNIYYNDKRHVKVINFARNFGKDAAIYAGLKASTSDLCSIIDSDMQQHPRYLLDMYTEITKDNSIDEIAMVNLYENNSVMQKFAKKNFYKLMNKLSGLKFHSGASDFRMFRNYVVKAILNMSEKNRFTKGLFSWVGFNIKYMDYSADQRLTGESKFKLKKQLSYATDGIVNFSTKPLRMITVLGTLVSFISFIYFIVILIQTLVSGKDVPGYASLMCVTLILGGLILLVLGIIGEYISKIYIETKNRPIYIEKNSLGFDKDIL